MAQKLNALYDMYVSETVHSTAQHSTGMVEDSTALHCNQI